MKPIKAQLQDLEWQIIRNPYDTPENAAKKLPEAKFSAIVDYLGYLNDRIDLLVPKSANKIPQPKKKGKENESF